MNECLNTGDFQILDAYLKFGVAHNGLVIIEGVTEKWGIRDLERFCNNERRVSFGQGFLFGKAKPIEEIALEIPEEARRLLEAVWKAQTI
ncbi:MAG: hypothetical protein AB1797_10560 [bacterium]